MADELSGNLAIQQQINSLVKELKVHSDGVANSFRSQTEVMEKFLGLLSETSKKMNDTASAAENMSNAIGKAANSSTSKRGLNDIIDSSKNANESLKNLGTGFKKSFSIGGEAIRKMRAQLSLSISLLGSFSKGIFGIGQSILAIPLGIFRQITEEASAAANMINPVRQEMENLREVMGNLSKGPAAGVIDSFDMLKKSSDNLGKSGISLTHIFGIDREGAARALAHLREMAVSMGPVFEVLSEQFESSADKLLILQNGLGISNEEMKSFGEISIATGRDLTDVLMENANMSIQMANRFGMSSKVIGKDLSYMSQNMGKFGSMTKEQMATASVFTRKLGLEIKQLEGLIGTFDDFEGAAQSASKLAQAFGMNVDAMKMMKEQDPAKRLDMLRQSFAATGRSIENMTRQEKALLAQTTGLDENIVSLALSNKNMGLSYEDIQKEAEKAGDKQLSQAEIMEEVGKNIKKLLENLNKTTSSFFQTFINGMSFGIRHTKEYREMMYTVSRALAETFRFGTKVGRMFVEMFPGIKEMIEAVRSFFATLSFKNSENTIRDFFKSLMDFEKVRESINALFGDTKSGVNKILGFFEPNGPFMKGLKDFGTASLNILTALIPNFANVISDYLDEFIKSIPEDISEIFSEIDTAKISSPIGRLFNEIYKAVVKLWPKIKEAFLKVFDLVTKDPTIRNVLIGVLGGLATIMFGPAAITGFFTIASGAIGLIFTSIGPMIWSAISTAIAAAGGWATVGSAILSALASVAGAINPAGLAVIAATIAVVIATALVTALGQMLKLIGEEAFVNFFSPNDPDSIIAGLAYYFYHGLVWASDTILDGFSNVFGGLFDAFNALLEGDSKALGDAILKILYGLGEIIGGAIVGLGVYILGILPTLVFKLNMAVLTLIEAISTLFPRLIATAFDYIAKSLGFGETKILEHLDWFFSWTLPSNWINWMTGAETSMSESSKKLGESMAGSMDDVSKKVADASKSSAEKIKSSTEGVSNSLGEIDFTSGLKLTGNMNNLADSLDSTLSTLDSKDLVTKLEKYRELSLGSSVKAVVDDIKLINSVLEDLGEIRVKSTIDKLGEKLKLETEVLNIERKPIQLNINLDLTMKAEDVEKNLMKVRDSATLKRA